MRTEAEVVELIEQYSELAKRIVLRYVPPKQYQQDNLVWDSIALESLWRAAADWEPKKARFNTHLTWVLRSAIFHQIEKQTRYHRRLQRYFKLRRELISYYPLQEAFANEEQAQAASVTKKLREATPLSERESLIYDRLFLRQQAPVEVAAEFGLSRQRVYALRQTVLDKLRRAAKNL